MKRKLHLLIIVAFLGVFISSCKKDEEVAPVDQRDQWIGNYVGETNGSITLTIAGQTSTQPLNGDVDFQIQKGNNSNEILMVDETETVRGVISGTSVTFDPMTTEQVQDGVTIQLTANTTGTLSGSVFNYKMVITGQGEYLGVNFPIEGIATTVATKQ